MHLTNATLTEQLRKEQNTSLTAHAEHIFVCWTPIWAPTGALYVTMQIRHKLQISLNSTPHCHSINATTSLVVVFISGDFERGAIYLQGLVIACAVEPSAILVETETPGHCLTNWEIIIIIGGQTPWHSQGHRAGHCETPDHQHICNVIASSKAIVAFSIFYLNSKNCTTWILHSINAIYDWLPLLLLLGMIARVPLS